MRVFINTTHAGHAGRQEMHRGRLMACVETPQRLTRVAEALQALGWPTETAPEHLAATTEALLARVHDPAYLAFLRSAWPRWRAQHPEAPEHEVDDLLPDVWPTRGMRQDRIPTNFSAEVGYYAFDSGSPITAGTWAAAWAGARCAVAAAEVVGRGAAASALALTRPPGHHAGADSYGGYCFINNAALAAEHLRDLGHARVAILDIDYHHGNGTQAIFAQRSDVLTLSIHGDPNTEYPFFLGHADERGEGLGLGANRNWPLPRGTGFELWRGALREAMEELQTWGATALVVPMGLDTADDDPISGFTLQAPDFGCIGRDLASLGLPTVFTFEGGYATEAIGRHAAELLRQHDRS